MTDPAERLLTEALRARADHASYDVTGVGDVVTTARGIRRRQLRNRSVLAAAAVLVVTVPTAVFLNGHGGTAPGPSDPSPSVTDSPRPFSLDSLRRGPDPHISYVEGHDFIGTDGSRHALPTAGGITAITPYHGGFLVADDQPVGASVGLHQYDAQGHEIASSCTTGSPVLSADQLDAAWVTISCPDSGAPASSAIHRGIASGMGDGETTQDISPVIVRLVGMTSETVVYTGLSGEGAWVTDLRHAPREIPGLFTARGVSSSAGLVSGQDAAGNGVVVDLASGDVVQTIPGWELGRFSPDGRYVEATQGRLGTPPVAIFDVRTGEQVVSEFGGSLGSPNPVAVAWEDPTHLLVLVDGGGHHAIVRLGTDGSRELATDVLPRSEQLVLAATP